MYEVLEQDGALLVVRSFLDSFVGGEVGRLSDQVTDSFWWLGKARNAQWLTSSGFCTWRAATSWSHRQLRELPDLSALSLDESHWHRALGVPVEPHRVFLAEVSRGAMTFTLGLAVTLTGAGPRVAAVFDPQTLVPCLNAVLDAAVGAGSAASSHGSLASSH